MAERKDFHVEIAQAASKHQNINVPQVSLSSHSCGERHNSRWLRAERRK